MSYLNHYSYERLSKIKINPKFKIKLINIGYDGLEVIFVTNDDKVYGFGNNESLGSGNEPTLIGELCDKQIISISCGYNFMIGLTKMGDLYSWGRNDYKQLGYHTYPGILSRPALIDDLFGKCVTSVNCGDHFTIVLTHKGQLYAFGYNFYGECGSVIADEEGLTPQLIEVNNESVLSVPNKFDFSGSDKKVVAISCGSNHCLALNEKWQVFGWGRNHCGQLGLGDNHERRSPTKLSSLSNVSIIKISCGQNHSLLLSSDGDIYSFGMNYNSQLGLRHKTNEYLPIKIVKSVKFIDIASDFRINISMAISKNKFVFYWGQTVSGDIDSPMKTKFHSFNDILEKYCVQKITHKTIDVSEPKYLLENRLMLTMNKLFNNEKTSDIKIRIGDKCIHALKWFLINSSEHFEKMFSNSFQESERDEIEIIDFEYNSYFAFIKYLHTESVDLEDIQELIELLNIANSYFEEDLKLKCVEKLGYTITVDNVCQLYSASVLYNAPELEDLCFDFMIKKFSEIIKTDSFKDLDSDYCKRLFVNLVEARILI